MSGGFDPKAYLEEPEQPYFDPHAYVAEEAAAPAKPTTSAGMAGLDHFANQAAFGYLPQLQGLVAKFMPDPNAAINAKLKAQGMNIQEPDFNSYTGARDATIARMGQEGEEHPIASAAGSVGGVIAGGSAMGGALKAMGAGAKAAGLMQASKAAAAAGDLAQAKKLANAARLARVAEGIKTGAAMGAAANPGDTEGEIDPLQLGDRYSNAKTGAMTGGLVSTAAEAVPVVADASSKYLDKKAALKAARALGRPTPTQATQMAASGQDAQIGRTLLDEGAVPILGTPSRIGSRVDALKEKVGQTIGDLVKNAGNAKRIDAEKLGLQILDSPELAAMRKTPGMEGTVAAIEKQVETLAKNGTMSLEEAQALRQGIDKSINFNKAAPDMRGAQEGLYQQRTAIRDAMNDSINTLNPGAGKDALLKANRNYSNLSKASDILDREMGRNQANHAVSLTDTIAGAAGLAHGGAMGAAIMGGINKFGRTFGNSMQARGYDAAAKALPYVSQAVKNNPALFQRIAQAAATPAKNSDMPMEPMDQQTLGIFKANPDLIDTIADPRIQSAIRKQLGRTPAKDQHFADGGEVKTIGEIIGFPGSGPAPKPAPKQPPRNFAQGGGPIPGVAAVKGNSAKNDTVPAKLSPGEIVLPRSVTMAKNAPEMAAKFVAAHLQGTSRGPDAWAQQGASKLGLEGDALSQVLQSPKGKQLLIQASDLSPNSKAMQRIKDQIQKGWGGK